ncbi:MAG: lycopene cyclase [Flavobacterium sp.]|nr:MAG: lycopene cyclase [Flavobacterium sp.]
MKHYHYIFAGSGLSSLMVVYRMVLCGEFANKRILLIDTDTKKSNDRTWCFWEKGAGNWDSIISKRWNTALFAGEHYRRELDFGGYSYKMIEGLDFYNFVFTELKKHPNVEFINQKISGYKDEGTKVSVSTEEASFTCEKLFNSIYNPLAVEANKKYPLLLQHFTGWHIRTKAPVFNDALPTFMDFSIPQKGNTRFMYVLPTSSTEALIEYTLFSKDLLSSNEYDDSIKEYIADLGITEYEIMYSEKGSIPMTSYPFWKHNTKNVLNIGTAGGWTKASTGYTFKNADKKAKSLISFLLKENDFSKFHKKNKFWFYDLLLLDILDRTNEKGAAIFSDLFRSGDAAIIFKFLDEETSLAEDLKVILKCPKTPFLQALFRRVAK